MDLKGCYSSNCQAWETPQKLFDELNKIFNFTLDPCSNEFNYKVKKHYTEKENGLIQNWANEIVFMNPPYGKDIKNWIKKAYEESKHALIVGLLPARTDTSYFHEYIYNKADIIFLRGRLRFEREGIPLKYAPFPSMIVIWKNKSKFYNFKDIDFNKIYAIKEK